MEKRSAKRHVVGLKAELLYGGKRYAGLVENISENGLYTIAYPLNKAIDFTSGICDISSRIARISFSSASS